MYAKSQYLLTFMAAENFHYITTRLMFLGFILISLQLVAEWHLLLFIDIYCPLRMDCNFSFFFTQLHHQLKST